MPARTYLLRRLFGVVLMVAAPSAAEAQITSLLCESNEAAVVGYYHTEAGSGKQAEKVGGPLERQKGKSQWRVDGVATATNVVRVTRYSGALHQIDVPTSVWRIETDPLGTGFILLPTDRAQGAAMEVMTITLATGAFVYSTQHVNPLWNRTTIFVGQCYRAP